MFTYIFSIIAIIISAGMAINSGILGAFTGSLPHYRLRAQRQEYPAQQYGKDEEPANTFATGTATENKTVQLFYESF